jgi:hypothetical protein
MSKKLILCKVTDTKELKVIGEVRFIGRRLDLIRAIRNLPPKSKRP